MHTLNDVERSYSYYAKLPLLYNIFPKLAFFGKDLRKRAINKLNLKQNYKVLDIACGTGLNFKQIEKIIGKSRKSKIYENPSDFHDPKIRKNFWISGKLETSLKFPTKGEIIAVDYSKEMLKQAKKLIKKNNYNNIKLIQADASNIKLETNFDAIISTLGFSSIPNHKAALKNAVNSLKKGKKLVILEGKLFNFKPLNILMPILRWNKSWDKNKNIIKDVKELFPNKEIKIKEYNLGSNFILELTN